MQTFQGTSASRSSANIAWWHDGGRRSRTGPLRRSLGRCRTWTWPDNAAGSERQGLEKKRNKQRNWRLILGIVDFSLVYPGCSSPLMMIVDQSWSKLGHDLKGWGPPTNVDIGIQSNKQKWWPQKTQVGFVGISLRLKKQVGISWLCKFWSWTRGPWVP